jgi:hypothetical protein
MVSTLFRSSFIKGCVATLAAIVALSTTMGASLSTTAFLLVLGAAPWILMLVLPRSAPSPSVAEILHTANTNAGRPWHR